MRAFTKIRFVVAALAAFALAPFSAHAQFVGGNASISATTASSNVGLPANTKTYPYAMIVPAEGSSNEVFYKLGTTSAITAATTSPALPSGGVCVNVGPNGYVAAITGTSTATVRISQLTLCPMFSGGSGGGGGGGGNVNLTGINGSAPSATNPLYVAPGTGATWAVTGTFWQATQPVSGTFWQATQPTSLASAQVASGAYASGSIGSGAMVDLGSQADSVCGSSTGSCSLIALIKYLNNAAVSAVPWLATTAWSTNSYSNGTTNPGAADLHGAPFVDIGAINGVALLAGNGVTGTGSPRVTIASDNTPFPVKIDQTTPGTTNLVQTPTTTNGGAATVKGGVAVVNGGSFYQAVAAGQIATVLQSSTGATGDYLSHCVIYPTSTTPGVVTVFDSTNTAANSAILFPGGASSVSNLVPFAIPVGAVSVNGAWKVTTGANVSVVCYGKFS